MRPIDADALVEAIKDYPYGFRGMIYGDINAQPTIDVPDRKVGKWYDWSFTAFDGCTVWHRVCSVCWYKRDDDNLDKDTNYCPNCGAKMDVSDNDVGEMERSKE
jgi:hypothetical protein